tara:strand:+ start:3015 stop:4790 length:1776 start_codon:yes stop_codon:yes gene_type:complete
MSWLKKREALQNAGPAVARALTKDKKLDTPKNTANRPPLIGTINIPDVPRGSLKINAWRGDIDQQAFWHKYHKSIDNLDIPIDTKKYLNELELARVEIIGSNEYLGSKINIVESVDAQAKLINSSAQNHDDQIPPLVLNIWVKNIANIRNGDDAQKLFSQNKKRFIKLNSAAKKLIDNIDDQKLYQDIALKILKDLGLYETKKPHNEKADDASSDDHSLKEESQEDLTEPISRAESMIDEDLEKGLSDEEDQSADLNQAEVDDKSIEEEIDLMRNSRNKAELINKQNYRVYSSQFDEIIDASSLSTFDETARLRRQLDQLMEPHLSTIGKLANRLQRLLQAQQNRSWDFNKEEGILDTSRLARVVARPGSSLSFKQETEINFKDTIISLLIDSSGSMRGRSMTIAAICADIIGSTLDRCNIKTELLGFTTKHWKGGETRKLWIKQGSQPNPGRLNDLRHIIFKSADDSFRRSRKNFGIMLREGLLKENVDGEALLWAHGRLAQRSEQRKILIVISDGAPVDDSTLSSNHSSILEEHLKTTISDIESKSEIELLAIGIGHDVAKYYDKSVTIHRAEELGNILLEQLTDLLRN